MLGMGDAQSHRAEVRDHRTRQKASPSLQDSFAQASYVYDEALGGYEAALASRDAGRRAAAELALAEAGRVLSRARAAIVRAKSPARIAPSVNFESLIRDPAHQLDPTGLVIASILTYQAAPSATAAAPRLWVSDERATEMWISQRLAASTAAASAYC